MERVIVPALKAYQKDQGTYPANLEALSPKYVSQIPLPTTGDGKWLYWRSEDGEFEIGFKDAGDDGHPSAFYSSDDGSWDIDTK